MIKSDDVCIRAVRLIDIDILYQLINTPTIVNYSAAFKQIHETEHLQWFKDIAQDKTKSLFIIEKANEIVGSVQLINIDLIHRNAELTIRLFSEENFGKGIGSSVLKLICNHGFNDLGLVRLWLRVFSDNLRAIKSYKKAGFIEEGVMKKAVYISGSFKDVIIMARLRDD